MLKVTKGDLNPMVSASGSFAADLLTKVQAVIPSTIDFAGAKKDYPINVTIVQKPNMKISGVLPLILTDFKIELPSLMGISIKDETPIEFEMQLTSAP